jgi:4-hydroxybenzoate polyprenyltransferase
MPTLPSGPLDAPVEDARPRSAASTDVPSVARALVLGMRPRQWPKNLLVYAAFLFTVNLAWEPGDPSSWLPLLGRATAGFAIFCLVSGADYLINDVRDAEADRLHPRKRFRPIASGALDPTVALSAAVVFIAIGIAAAFVLDSKFGLVVIAYLAMMLAYSYALKRVVILDLMIISVGFLLRAMGGAFIIDVSVSPWLYLITILAALFLAIHKRRGEISSLKGRGDLASHRAVLEEYPPGLLDQMVAVVSSSTIMAYSIYVVTAENLPSNHAMVFSVPFVLYGVFRYQYLVHQKGLGDSPEEVFLQDAPLLIDIFLWVATVAGILLIFRD